MIDKKLRHYRIVEKIGAGGMGEVYRAHDEHLNRDVAVKVLPTGALEDETARKRFRSEALALSKLNHPHIATIYDFDTQEEMDFLVMEYVAGATLKEKLAGGPLSEKEIVRLGAQIADALEAAHEQGIIHRDLKPGNIALTGKDQVKVLDFGLAKLLHRDDDLAEAATVESLTRTAEITGTVPYMAPEQLRGEPADARSDIYALGTVLYEMAAGQRPFQAKSFPALTDAIFHQAPASLSSLQPNLTPRLEETILKCLEKDPGYRYQSVREVLVDLRRLAAPTTVTMARPPARRRRRSLLAGAGVAALLLIGLAVGLSVPAVRDRLLGAPGPRVITSLAVLPLENLSGDPEQEYFADGMTEALITDLSKIGALKVISRTSAMRYKGARKPLPEIAAELKVDALIEGTVLHVGDRVRITAQLIEAATDQHLWAQSYERDMKDVLHLQGEVARAIAEEIQAKLSPQEQTRLSTARAVKPQAYEAYLKARYNWNKRHREAVLEGLRYFEEAIEIDPTYALAHVGVADSYAVMGANQWLAPGQALPKAKAAARDALELDDTLAEAHTTLALVLQSEWDWEGAEREYERALGLNPGYAVAHQWYSVLLSETGKHERALAGARRAAELDPLSPTIAMNVGQALYMARRYEEARRAFSRMLEEHPDFFPTRYYLGGIHVQGGQLAEGIAELQKAAALSSDDTQVMAALGYAYARAGREAEARGVLQELGRLAGEQYVSPYLPAMVHAGLDEKGKALELLEEAYAQHDSALSWLDVEPMFDSLRADTRFQDLLRRMKLSR